MAPESRVLLGGVAHHFNRLHHHRDTNKMGMLPIVACTTGFMPPPLTRLIVSNPDRWFGEEETLEEVEAATVPEDTGVGHRLLCMLTSFCCGKREEREESYG